MTELPVNAISWFAIPARDYEKSISFYESLLDVSLIRETSGEGEAEASYAMFPSQKGPVEGVAGALTPADRIEPATGGVVIYLVCSDIDACLLRLEGLGGKILAPKMSLPGDMGDIAVIADLDGNPVGLHQM